MNRRSTHLAPALLASAIFAAPAFAGEKHREAGAHVHGHGSLAIAIEGNKVEMELEAPGMDLVGFEHEANTDADKAAVDKAKSLLGDPLALFKLPDAAGCKVVAAEADLEAEDEEHDDKNAEHGKDEGNGNDKAHADEGHHASFHAAYTLECDNVAALTAIEFAYFKTFPGAASLGVNIVSASVQTAEDVSRDKPLLQLGNK